MSENSKGSPFYIFRHCDTVQKSHFKIFLGNFFQSLKGPPLIFFHILQPAGVSQSPKGPPFTFFDTVTLFNSFFFIFCHQLEFHKTQRVPPFTILSLRYSADFGRSRLVKLIERSSSFVVSILPSLPEISRDHILDDRDHQSANFALIFQQIFCNLYTIFVSSDSIANAQKPDSTCEKKLFLGGYFLHN